MPCGALFVSVLNVKIYQKGEIIVLENRNNNSEYESRRSEDVRKTKILEKFVDKIYAENGIKIIRIEDEELQKRGVDFVHITENEQRCVDEKFAIKYFDQDLKTFAFELSSHNNKNNNGWFTSDHMLTTYYVILWFRSDEELQNIYSYDLCYIEKEKSNADKLTRLEDVRIPENFDYDKIKSMSFEAKDKLKKIRPVTISQASRISGVAPSDISILLIHMGR